MKLAAFDLEIAKVVPDNGDWREHWPLGISCAAVALEGGEIVRWQSAPGEPAMSREACVAMLHDMCDLTLQEYRMCTWNGAAFDYKVLAEETGLAESVALECLQHVDMMLPVVFQKGHFLGLDKVCVSVGLAGKTHEVTLRDGTELTGMNGADAPRLWAEGEREAVLTYLDGDVLQTLALAERLRENTSVTWTSNRGKLQQVRIPLQTVAEVYQWGYPPVDTSWMTDPPKREQFTEWMPESCRMRLIPAVQMELL